MFGRLVDNLHGGFGLVDNLSMTYEGNILTSVRDNCVLEVSIARGFFVTRKTLEHLFGRC